MSKLRTSSQSERVLKNWKIFACSFWPAVIRLSAPHQTGWTGEQILSNWSGDLQAGWTVLDCRQ